jgi:molybdopterin-guanine dinucleotide biosynthesis protein A
MTGVILAGGQNTRFPTLKAFINIEGSPIIERNLKLLKELFDEVLISTNMPERYFYLGAPLIGDVLSSEGPMSGIYSALLNAKSDCVFVTACDMPFIKKELISLIRERCGGADAVIPVYNNEPQPLFGVYCKTALPYIEEGIINKKTTLKRFLDNIKTAYIGEADIRKIDPEGMSFVNINTLEDYEKIKAVS